jgi:anti-anti-sigma regulatory factor
VIPIQTEQYTHRLPTRNGYVIDGRIAWWKVQSSRQATVLTVVGELDASNADRFERCVRDVMAHGAPFVIDLAGVTFIGLQSLRTLVKIDHAYRWAVVIDPAMAPVFKLIDGDAELPLCDSLDQALRSVTPAKGNLLRLFG